MILMDNINEVDMKKYLIIGLLFVLCLGLGGCGEKSDAVKFKEEYEAVNGQKSGNNIIRTLDIVEDNPFIYKNAQDIVEAINNDETFVVYFGFATCPWCRSVLPYLIKTAKENNIEKIYYVDVKEIRDTIAFDDETQEFKTTKEGDKGYMKLTELLSDVLSDYSLTDQDGNSLTTGTKRIYAPNIVVVERGIPIGMASGISDYLNDPYMELTKEITDDTENKFNELFDLLNHGVCTKEEGC